MWGDCSIDGYDCSEAEFTAGLFANIYVTIGDADVHINGIELFDCDISGVHITGEGMERSTLVVENAAAAANN